MILCKLIGHNSTHSQNRKNKIDVHKKKKNNCIMENQVTSYILKQQWCLSVRAVPGKFFQSLPVPMVCFVEGGGGGGGSVNFKK